MEPFKIKEMSSGNHKYQLLFTNTGDSSIVFQINSIDLLKLSLHEIESANILNRSGWIIGNVTWNSDIDSYSVHYGEMDFPISKEFVDPYLPETVPELESRIVVEEKTARPKEKDKIPEEIATPDTQFVIPSQNYSNPKLHQGQFANFSDDVWNQAIIETTEKYEEDIRRNKPNLEPKIPKNSKIRAFWHFTHIDNLPTILKYGIIARNYLKQCGICHEPIKFIDISNPGVQKNRSVKGCHNYVPLFFANASPMIPSIQHKDKDQGHLDTICLEIDPDILFVDGMKFTPENAAVIGNFNFYSDVELLSELEWPLIHLEPEEAWKYCEDKDKHLRSAELLIKYIITSNFIRRIHVSNSDALEKSDQILREMNRIIPIENRIKWGGVDTKDLFK